MTGGFALAARWAGIETVQFVEIDPFCQKVLQKNFPGVPIHDDIKTFTYTAPIENDKRGRGIMDETKEGQEGGDNAFSPCNQSNPFLLTGGFPCQPFSCAGKRRGKEDDRWLWKEMLRIIGKCKPAWIIAENVGGILGMVEFDSLLEMDDKKYSEDEMANGQVGVGEVRERIGRGILDEIMEDLEKEGYAIQAFIIPACAVNAPHRRDRVWIVGHAGQRNGCKGWDNKTRTETKRGNSANQYQRSSQTDCHTPCEDWAEREWLRHAPDTDNEGLQRHGEHGECSSKRPAGTGTWKEPWLEVATRLCRVDDGVSRKLDRVNRLKALGNSIVPQVAYEIMKGIRGQV